MNFGDALAAVKDGHAVARKGWNGAGQYIYLISARSLQVGLKYGYAEYAGAPTFTDAIAIRTTHKQIQVGWVPSQSDMLASDWYVRGTM